MYQNYQAKIYDSLYSYNMRSEASNVAEPFCVDQVELDVHLDRLGCGTLMLVGNPKAIFNRKFYMLDSDHYDRVTKEVNGEVLVPATYAHKYFFPTLGEWNQSYMPDADGYVNLNRVCAELKIPMTYDRESGLVAVTPAPVAPITKKTDPKLIERMTQALKGDPWMPEPKYNNSEQTRQVIVQSSFQRGSHSVGKKRYINLYSPSLLITKDAHGRTVYYVSHENADSAYGTLGEVATETVVLRSYDHGKTWEKVLVWNNIRWAMMFEVAGKVHLVGTTLHPDHPKQWNVAIARIDDSVRVTQGILPNTGSYTAPNTVLVRNGRVYIPSTPCAMSAPADSNLLDPKNWTVCESISPYLCNRDWYFSETGAEGLETLWPLEGNIIEGRDGKIYEMLRLEQQPNNGYAGLLELSEDGKTCKLAECCNGIVEMPTTVTKFQVTFNEATGLYLSLANYPSLPMPSPSRGAHPPAGHRNVLALVASPDLVNWKVIDILLVDRAVMNPAASAKAHGFQYVIWDIDGDDLVYVVREASGYARCFHDGSEVTMYRLHNYKALVEDRYPKTEFWKNPNRRKTQA